MAAARNHFINARDGHSLHLPVVVEGVETNEQANMLRQMGAHYAQGFLYYRPMPAKDFEALLDGGNNN